MQIKKILFLAIVFLASFSYLLTMDSKKLRKRSVTQIERSQNKQTHKRKKRRKKKNNPKAQIKVQSKNPLDVIFATLDNSYICPLTALALSAYFGIPPLYQYYFKDAQA